MRIECRVGLARRNLLADRRRLVLGIGGIGLALMLVLVLDGLWEGMKAGSTIYPDRVGADVYVAQPGVTNFLGETSTLSRDVVSEVRRTPGVDWAAPVRGRFVVFALHGKKVAAYLVGSVPGLHGGPWEITDGHRVRRDDEIVVDDALARRHGLVLGDVVEIAGKRLRIVGLADASAVMTGFVFMTHDATDTLLRAPGTTSYVLAGTDDPSRVAKRLRARALNVLTAEQLATNDRELYAGIFGSAIRLMVAVAFVVGCITIALTVYAAVAERRHEFGVVKALGGTAAYITEVVVRQTLVLTAVGLVVGGALYLGVRALLATVRPQFDVTLTTAGLTRAVLAALLMAAIASVVPARRVATADPASVYRGE